ncbi:methyltransferase [Azospira restricta]|uniref:Methyltransferase n=1 Tax=Azospira restricta TaxID=404405 RepID=A0A974SSL1_9RHOO|nr:methyltransferase [Azospira restricta]QRJ65563.1 methyltransferase [Azospira restricta]
MTPHARRRAALDRWLAELAPLWTPSPFCVARPAWCDTQPALAEALLALDDTTLAALSADDDAARAFLIPHLPLLADLPALIDLPERDAAPAPVSRPAWQYIPGRKAAQIDAFAAAVGAPRAPLVEWCAGKGHLGRRFLMAWGGEARALERNATLCREGEALSARAGLAQRFAVADVLAPESAASLAGAHAIALHACGDLHRRLIDLAGPAGAHALDVAPCCYPLGADDRYRPRGGDSALVLDRNALRLAVTETVTASPRLAAASERLSAWKLAFVGLREAHAPGVPYRTFKPTPAAWTQQGFAFFLQALAARENLPLDPKLDFAAADAAGWARHRAARRLQLPRLACRRAIEVWLLHDLALGLEGAGFEAELHRFCARTLTPRNVIVSARR